MTRINYDAIPNKLKQREQWVCWLAVEDQESGKPDKIPVKVKTGRNASHSNPKTWSSYQHAVDFYENQKPVVVTVGKGETKRTVKGVPTGIGYVFSKDDSYVGIDLDNCRDSEMGEIAQWAQEFIDLCQTYTEVSPSGKGVKLWIKGKMPGNKGRRNDRYETGGVEIYPHTRFFTVTGQHLEGAPLTIAHNTDALVEITDKVFAKDEPKRETRKPSEPITGDDKVLIEKAITAKNGDKFRKLWEGDISDYHHENGTPDQSRADLALCSYLAFWTQRDEGRISRLFRQSGLYRDKWERDDYREWTIAKAIEGATAYDANYRSGASGTRNGDDTDGNGGSSDGVEYRTMEKVKEEIQNLAKEHEEGTKAQPETTSETESNAEAVDTSENESNDEPDAESESEAEAESLDYKIKNHLWDTKVAVDASHWTSAELGSFSDWLNAKFDITKSWLNNWQKAVNEEKRKRSTEAKAAWAEKVTEAKKDAKQTLSVSEGEGCYLKKELIGFTFVDRPISSFLIQPKLRVWLDGKENLKVDFVTLEQTYPDTMIRRRDWNGNDRFMDVFPSVDLQWRGGLNDVQEVLAIVAGYDVPKKQGTTQLGRHDGGLWLLPDGMAYNSEGLVTDSELVYLPAGGRGELDDKIDISEIDDNTYTDLLDGVYSNLFAVNLPTVTLPIIGWFFATPFKSQFSVKYEGFPHLSIAGTRGAGKSTLLRLMWRLMGFKVGDAGKLFSSTETDFVMLKLLSSTTTIPIIFDEYKPYDMPPQRLKALTRLLRKAYDGEKEFRGRPDQTTTEYSLSAPIAIAGEVALTEGAMLERIIAVEMSPNDLTATMRKAYQALRTLPLQAFCSRFIPFALRTDFEKELNQAEVLGADLLDDMNTLPDRIRNNLTVLIFGFNQFIRFGIEQGIVDEADDLTDVLAEAVTTVKIALCGDDGVTKVALDYMIGHLATMAETKRLVSKRDYVARETSEDITIRFDSCFAEFRKFHRETQMDSEILNAQAYRKQMKENRERGGYITETSALVKFGTIPKRAIIIDAKRAEVFGLDLSGFFGNEDDKSSVDGNTGNTR